jgi:hypothetical protein
MLASPSSAPRRTLERATQAVTAGASTGSPGKRAAATWRRTMRVTISAVNRGRRNAVATVSTAML